jgi:hypothetical protein
VLSQSTTAVTIRVISGDTPLNEATVLITKPDGKQVNLGHTDHSGSLVVSGPLLGRLRISLSGQELASRMVAASELLIEFHIDARVIGKTVARQTQAPSISRQDVASVVFGDPTSALNTDPSYRSASEGGASGSLLNGIPVPLPVINGSPFGIPSDLVSSVQIIDTGQSFGEPNYVTQRPTETVLLQAKASFASDDQEKSAGIVWAGRFRDRAFGYSVTANVSGNEGVLHGQSFSDLSGQSYLHDTAHHSYDATALLTYSANAHLNVEAFDLSSVNSGREISSTSLGTAIDGYGPNIPRDDSNNIAYVNVSNVQKATSLEGVVVGFGGSGFTDGINATFLNVPTPFEQSYRYGGSFAQVQYNLYLGHEIRFGLSASRQSITSETADNFANAIESSDEFEQKVDISQGIANGFLQTATIVNSIQSGAYAGDVVGFSYRASQAFRGSNVAIFAGKGLDQNLLAQTAKSFVGSDPATAQYSCVPSFVNFSEPSAVGSTHPTRAYAGIDASFGDKRTSWIEVSDVQEYLANPIFAATSSVPFTAVDPEIQARFFASCPQLVSGSAYQTQSVTERSGNQNHAFAHAVVRRGRFFVDTFYEILTETVNGGPTGQTSQTLPFPGVPLHRANLLFGYGSDAVVAGLDLFYSSSNNEYNLPSYLTGAVGLRLRRGSTSFQVSAQNLISPYRGLFSLASFGVPSPTIDGSLSPTFASPLRTGVKIQITRVF